MMTHQGLVVPLCAAVCLLGFALGCLTGGEVAEREVPPTSTEVDTPMDEAAPAEEVPMDEAADEPSEVAERAELPLGPAVPFNTDAPSNVVDLFMSLPQAHLHSRIFGEDQESRERVLRRLDPGPGPQAFMPHRVVLDLRNGYVAFHQPGDGDSETMAFAYFKLADGAKLLAQESTNSPMCGEVSEVWFTRFDDGGWNDVTAEVWEAPTWSDFVDGDTDGFPDGPDVAVSIPRTGKDVTVTLSECGTLSLSDEQHKRLAREQVVRHFDAGRFPR